MAGKKKDRNMPNADIEKDLDFERDEDTIPDLDIDEEGMELDQYDEEEEGPGGFEGNPNVEKSESMKRNERSNKE